MREAAKGASTAEAKLDAGSALDGAEVVVDAARVLADEPLLNLHCGEEGAFVEVEATGNVALRRGSAGGDGADELPAAVVGSNGPRGDRGHGRRGGGSRRRGVAQEIVEVDLRRYGAQLW